MPAGLSEMGSVAKSKSTVDPWSRAKTNDRFSGPNSMNTAAYAFERSKSPAPESKKPRPPKAEKRAASVPKARPPAANKSPNATPLKRSPSNSRTSPEHNRQSMTGHGDSQTSINNPLGSGRSASSAFAAPITKGRFDSGPGSFYAVTPGHATPGVGTFNPDDGPNAFGNLGGKSPKSAAKPSPGMAPTSKGRFDGPNAIYAGATPKKGSEKKKRASTPTAQDKKVEEWSRRLGLGAVAGAKAAPVLKEVDEAREHAEALARQAVQEKEAAEEAAMEATRKAEWMTNRAQERVAEAEERCERAEGAAAQLRVEHDDLASQLEEMRMEAQKAKAEADALRNQLAKLPNRVKSPKPDNRVIDRRPVRLRGTVDADAQSNREKVEARKAKREEHFKAIEAERLAKEDKIKAEQLEKSKAAISGRRPGSARKSVGGAPAPPPPPEALKGFALVLPPDKIKASPPSKSQVTSQRHQQVDDNENEEAGTFSRRSSGEFEHPLGLLKSDSHRSVERAAFSPARAPAATAKRNSVSPMAPPQPPEQQHEEEEEELDVSDPMEAEDHDEYHEEDVAGEDHDDEAHYDDEVEEEEFEYGYDGYAPSAAAPVASAPVAAKPPPPPPSSFGGSLYSAPQQLDVSSAAGAMAREAEEDTASEGGFEEEAAAEVGSGRPTGMSSHNHSPSGSQIEEEEEEEKQSNSPPLIIGKLGEAPAPFEFSQMEFENSSAEFAAAEAHAQQKANYLEDASTALKGGLAAIHYANGKSHSGNNASLDALLGSMRDSKDWDKAKAGLNEHAYGVNADDIVDDEPYSAADAAIRAVLSESAPVPALSLFGRQSSNSNREAPQDDFLSRLAKAEELPASPGGMKSRGLGLFNRGVSVS